MQCMDCQADLSALFALQGLQAGKGGGQQLQYDGCIDVRHNTCHTQENLAYLSPLAGTKVGWMQVQEADRVNEPCSLQKPSSSQKP